MNEIDFTSHAIFPTGDKEQTPPCLHRFELNGAPKNEIAARPFSICAYGNVKHHYPNGDTVTKPLEDRTHSSAVEAMTRFHTDVVKQVQQAVANHPVVIIGMAHNPHVRHARQALKTANIEFKYLEFGSYLSQWKPRLAIKLWSGWPTYPQVFVQGKLLGGASETRKALQDGSLTQYLSSDSESAE